MLISRLPVAKVSHFARKALGQPVLESVEAGWGDRRANACQTEANPDGFGLKGLG